MLKMAEQIEISQAEYKRLANKAGAVSVKDLYGQHFIVIGSFLFKESMAYGEEEDYSEN